MLKAIPQVTPDQPLVSVVMPVYNAERFVEAAMESILLQTYSPLELIVVDDGSADRSWVIIQKLAQRDARVRPLAVQHGGTSVALNTGVAAASGSYIALMDADDLALPERVAIQIDYLRRTGADVCGACVQSFSSDGETSKKESDQEILLWFPESHAAIRSELLFRCALLPSAVLMRADILRAHPYVPGLVFQDYEMWTRLAPHYRLANCPRILVRYRCHAQQVSRVQKAQNQQDMAHYRRLYFFALFPEAGLEEFEAFERLALRQAHSTLADLETAGKWLLRVSDVPDVFLRKRMAERWLGACSRSAALGPACFDLYRRMAPKFDQPLLCSLPNPRSLYKLRLRCLLRVAAGSSKEQPLRAFVSNFVRTRNNNHAA